MRKLPRPLRQIFRPITPRSSVVEQGLVLVSIVGAVILAVTALVVQRINTEAADAGKRSIRTIETAATLDKLQLALRDGDMAGRDLTSGRPRDRSDVERFDAARFQARLNLASLGPLTGDDSDQAERLSRLTPLIDRKFAQGLRSYENYTPGSRDEIDGLIATMREQEGKRLDRARAIQGAANDKSTWILVGALGIVSLLSLVFWMLLKYEFNARRTLEARLIESATKDELTGIANRSDFEHKLVQEWAFRIRYATALSLIVIDVDQLKALNEQWGHVAGDAVLREVARRLGSRIKRAELLARTGGDEFAILTPQYRKEALSLAEQLRETIADGPFFVPGPERPLHLKLTVSIGVAEASDVDTPRQLLAAADEAMYEAKDHGRNVVQSFRPQSTMGGIRVTTLDQVPAKTEPKAMTIV
jgi:diguanylate cyclase (GGDEF)-like protein